jgi:hypothetical protein
MAKNRNYIPRNDAKFNTWFKNLTQYVAAKTSGGAAAEWKHIPAEAVNELLDAYTDWYTHYAPTLKPHTPGQTTAKNNARKRAEKVIRSFVNRYLHFEPVTDDERVDMEIPNRAVTRRPIPDPVSQAMCKIAYPGPGLLELSHFQPLGGPPPDSRADYGVKVFYGITGEPTEDEPVRLKKPPKSGNDLPKSRFTRTKKMRFTFIGDSGNTVYFSLRYESPKGGEGPLCPIFSAVIP